MKSTFCFILLSFVLSIHAQNSPSEICGYQKEVERILKTKPNFLKWQEAWMRQAMNEAMEQSSAAKRGDIVSDTLYYEIPVVFHVLWNSANENIPDSNIYSQINELNLAYRKLTSDTSRIRSIFKNIAADVKVQFRIANKDPYGNASTGITRTYTNRTTFATNQYGSYSEDMKDSLNGGYKAWDPTKYLNIWVCNMAYPNYVAITLGFATPPTGAPNWDNAGNVTKDPEDLQTGVVLHYRTVGRNNAQSIGNYKEGKTAVHEVGHYLGLRHVWGDGPAQAGCSYDDGIDDTPNTRYSNSTCTGQNTCGAGTAGDLPDQTENYMDYALDGCAAMFTKKQAAIMQYVLRNFRTTLPLLNINIDTLPDPPKSLQMVIFPNPVNNSGVLNMRLEGTNSNPYSFELYNAIGQKISLGQLTEGNNSIALTAVSNGAYCFVVKDKNGAVIHTERLIVY